MLDLQAKFTELTAELENKQLEVEEVNSHFSLILFFGYLDTDGICANPDGRPLPHLIENDQKTISHS